jgi:hypothetical protein
MPNDDWLGIWQNQPVENITMSLEEITRRAGSFERRIRNRNRREYIAGLVVVVFFGYNLFRAPSLLPRIALALNIAGALYVMYQLHRRGSPATLPRDMGLISSLEFHRRELLRQRDALQSIWSWYLAPFVPGLLAIAIMASPKRPLWSALFIAGAAALFAGIWRLNQWAAHKLSLQIEELNKVGGQS